MSWRFSYAGVIGVVHVERMRDSSVTHAKGEASVQPMGQMSALAVFWHRYLQDGRCRDQGFSFKAPSAEFLQLQEPSTERWDFS